MRITDVVHTGVDFPYRWPSGNVENYPWWIEYRTVDTDGQHQARVGFTTRPVYGRDRTRVCVWIDDKPEAEFVGADDFDTTGEVLTRILPRRNEMCHYPDDTPPDRYKQFAVIGFPTRVTGPYVPSCWAVVANVSDHTTLIGSAALKRRTRGR